MPLTRHLYELDEVVSALQTCLRNRWPRASFWLWELLHSEEETLALNTLRTSWIWYGAPYDTGLLAINPKIQDDWIHLLCRIEHAIATASEKGKLTVFNLMQRTANHPKRTTMTPLPKTAKTKARRAAIEAAIGDDEPLHVQFCIALDAACRQHNPFNAIWLFQAAQPIFCQEDMWTVLDIICRPSRTSAMELLQKIDTIDAQAAAILMLCQSTADVKESIVVPKSEILYTRRSWTTLDEQIGRRAARVHDIPADALHRETTRGRLSSKYTNISEVRDPVASLFEGCTWWQRTLREIGAIQDDETGAVVFPDDDVMESFYSTHFPDDIPDEWPSMYQFRGHGRGVAETATDPPHLSVRDTLVERRFWNAGIHVPGRAEKKLTLKGAAKKAV